MREYGRGRLSGLRRLGIQLKRLVGMLCCPWDCLLIYGSSVSILRFCLAGRKSFSPGRLTEAHELSSTTADWLPIPSSRATWAQLAPGWLTCSMAPCLNSVLNFPLFDINTPFACYEAFLECPYNRGRTQGGFSIINFQTTSSWVILFQVPSASECICC